METTLTEPPLGVDRAEIGETLVELRNECAGFSDFVEELLDQMDQLRKEVEEKARLLERERHTLAESQELWKQQTLARESAQDVDLGRLLELEVEREEVKRELGLVRKRATEMAETLAEQQRKMAAEREEWTGELQTMHRLLERQTKLFG